MESRKPYLATPARTHPWAVLFAVHSGDRPFPASRSATHSLASQRTIALRSCSLQVYALRLPAPGYRWDERGPTPPPYRKRATSSPSLSCRSSRLSGSTFFFYLGLSRASAMSSSIIEASANFLAILFAAPAFHTEKLNTAKVLGCALGFAGVALVNLSGADGTFGFTLDGEGFILASTVAGALSTCLIGIFSREHDGVLLAGWQF